MFWSVNRTENWTRRTVGIYVGSAAFKFGLRYSVPNTRTKNLELHYAYEYAACIKFRKVLKWSPTESESQSKCTIKLSQTSGSGS